MQFTQIELLLIILISILIFYIVYHMANCPVYKYSHSINISSENSVIAPEIMTHFNLPLININNESSPQKSVCDIGRPRCNIYQSNTELYSNCMNDLANYIDNGCNKNQFSFQ
jgi:hypothetical protein